MRNNISNDTYVKQFIHHLIATSDTNIKLQDGFTCYLSYKHVYEPLLSIHIQ